MIKTPKNELTYMHFTVFDTDGVSPLTGQAGSCTSSLRRNGEAAAETVSINEISSTGRYYASFTPRLIGVYDLEIGCPDDRVIGESFVIENIELETVFDIIQGNDIIQECDIHEDFDNGIPSWLSMSNPAEVSIVNYNGRTNVIKHDCADNGGTDNWIAKYDEITSILPTRGYFHYFVANSNVSYRFFMSGQANDGGNAFYFEMKSSNWYTTGGAKLTKSGGGSFSNTSNAQWYEIKLYFCCDNSGYQGLGQYQWKVNIDGQDSINYSFDSNKSHVVRYKAQQFVHNLLDFYHDDLILYGEMDVESLPADILEDTNEIQGKLPTNYIMGSSDQSDKDDEIDDIKTIVDNLPNSGALSDIDAGVNNIEAKLPVNNIADQTLIDADLTNIETKIDTIDGIVDLIKPETDKIQTIDDNLDSVLEDTGTTLPATLSTIDGKVDTVDTVVDAIKSKTDNLPADPASETNVDANETKIDTIDGIVDAIKLVTDNLPDSGALTTLITHFTDIKGAGWTDENLTTLDTLIDAIKAKTDNLPADPASETNVDANETKIDTIDTIVDAIKAITDNLPDSGALTTIITHLTDIKGAGWSDENLTTIDSIVDAIKAKTDNLPADPASETNIDANETKIDTIDGKIDGMQLDVDDILVDTAEIQGKLPTNDIADQTILEGKIDTIDGNVDAIKLKTDYIPDNLEDVIDRMLGLLGDNSVMEYSFTDSNHVKTEVWVYDSKTNAQTHDKITGLVYTYTSEITYSAGNPSKQESVRDS